jgi:DNA polymerase-1
LNSAGSRPVSFYGSKDAEVIFIGGHPSKEDVDAGRPLLGPSGNLLRSRITKRGLFKERLYFASSVRCYKETATTGELAEASKVCRVYVAGLIKKIQPKCVVTLGDLALRQITGLKGITKYRGEVLFIEEFNTLCLPTFSPSGVEKDPSRGPLIDNDIESLSRLVNSGYAPNSLSDNIICKGLSYIDELLKEADKRVVRIALDTETTSLDNLASDSKMIGYSISYHDNKGCMVFLIDPEDVPVDGSLFESKWVYSTYREDAKERLLLLQKVLNHKNIRITMQHGSFDMHFISRVFKDFSLGEPNFRNYDVELQVAAHILDEEKFKYASLSTLNEAFGKTQSEWKDQFSKTQITVDTETLEKYAVEDAVRTLQVGRRLVSSLKQEPKLLHYFNTFAMPATTIGLYTLEANGVLVDPEKMIQARFDIANRLTECEEKLRSMVPEKIYTKYHKEEVFTRKDFVRDILFSELGFNLVPLDKTNSGMASVNKGSIARLKRKKLPSTSTKGFLHRPEEFLRQYEEWIALFGLSSRSLSQLQSYVREDGRIHSNYTLCSAVTGRVSSSSPNMMNIVARGSGASLIKSIVTARDGYLLLEADFSQAELRWIAHSSQDAEMLKVYRNGEDIHLKTAQAISPNWNSLSDAEKKVVRTKSKSLNFGVVYGISAHGLSNYCQEAYGQDMSVQEAEQLIKRWFTTYPGVKRWQKITERFATVNGYVESPLGRRRRASGLRSKKQEEVSAALRQVVNAPIQGASSDTALLALVSILIDEGIPKDIVKPIMFVHDSLTFEIKEEYIDEMAKKIYDHLVNPPLEKLFGIKLSVPLDVDMAVGRNKAEMKEFLCK